MRSWGWACLFVLALSAHLQADDKPDPVVDGKNLTEWILESKEPPTDLHVRSAYATLGEFVGEPRAVAALALGASDGRKMRKMRKRRNRCFRERNP